MTRGTTALVALAMACLLIFGFTGATAQSAGQATSDPPLRHAERATVRVISIFYDADRQFLNADTGSGFVVTPGNVVTNRHVVSYDGATYALVYVIPHRDSGERGVQAKIVDAWEEGDLALLRAPDLLAPPLTLAAVMPDKDATVHALGYPGITDQIRDLPLEEILRPSEPYVTPGSIALFSAVAPGGRRLDTIFHTAAVNPGNSGGPLVDGCGHVIGVNTWTAGSTISSEGISVPAGQFIATKSTNLIRYLSSLGLTPAVDNDACAPAVVISPEVEGRLKAAEQALAAEQAARKAEVEAAAEARANLMNLIGWGLGGVAIIGLAALVAYGVWGRGRWFASAVTNPPTANPNSDAAPTVSDPQSADHRSPLPVALIIPTVIALGVGGYFITSALLRKKPEPPTAVTSTNHFLTCALSASETRNPAPGAGSLVFTFDDARQCVNDRTPYEATGGKFVRIMLQAKGRTLSRLELSSDATTFTRQDFSLDKQAFETLNASRKSESAPICSATGRPDPATTAALARLRTLSDPFVGRPPDALMTWHCKVQNIPAGSE